MTVQSSLWVSAGIEEACRLDGHANLASFSSAMLWCALKFWTFAGKQLSIHLPSSSAQTLFSRCLSLRGRLKQHCQQPPCCFLLLSALYCAFVRLNTRKKKNTARNSSAGNREGVRFMILFWVITRICLHALILNISFLIQSNVFSSLFKALRLLIVLGQACVSRPIRACLNIKQALIGQLTHVWPSTANNNRAAGHLA